MKFDKLTEAYLKVVNEDNSSPVYHQLNDFINKEFGGNLSEFLSATGQSICSLASLSHESAIELAHLVDQIEDLINND
jgi:hypothetical protein